MLFTAFMILFAMFFGVRLLWVLGTALMRTVPKTDAKSVLALGVFNIACNMGYTVLCAWILTKVF